MSVNCTEILPDLWLFADTCNVYVVKHREHAIAIDFGSGEWLQQLPALGVEHLDHVFLTHHHADQCAGLAGQESWPFEVHAPAGEQAFLDPARAADCGPPPWFRMGCPPSYSPPLRVAGIKYDMAGFTSMLWGRRRLRFMHTPGHGPHACTLLLDHQSKQVAFCGDAAHAGGTLWQPFHLEWDHWTGRGALAAWEGVERLRGAAIHLLCPSHGPVVEEQPYVELRHLSERLLDFYRAKGQMTPGESDRYLKPQILSCGALGYLPHLYQFGGNGYLLVSETGEGLVVDPFSPDMPVLEQLLQEIGGVRPAAMVVSHYHYDHCDGIPYLRERYGAEAWLHPLIAEPWADPAQAYLPWLLPEPMHADRLWPQRGAWTWHEYEFRVAPWPGQTWWHCAFAAPIDGHVVLFAGDTFVPSSRWNGTGGFCAYNNSRFSEGFVPSAELALAWRPDIVAGGHGNCYRFFPAKFRKAIQWAKRAELAVRDLCPSGDLEQDYYIVHKLLRGG